MKKFAAICAACILFLTLVIEANPLIVFYLNELMMEPSDPHAWQLEIRNIFTEDLTGWSLRSAAGTQAFKTGIDWQKELVVITESDLEGPLRVNPTGDRLALLDPHDTEMGYIVFGDLASSDIAAPHAGQSICLEEHLDPQNQQIYFYYLDSSPTLGTTNDGCRGSIDGKVQDMSGNPLEAVRVHFGWDSFTGPKYVTTDAEGAYSIDRMDTRKVDLHFRKTGYSEGHELLQVWPDSTVTVNMTMLVDPNPVASPPALPQTMQLEQYPNPVSGRSMFRFTLPLSDAVDLSVYDSGGRKIATLLSSYLLYGEHHVLWNTGDIPPGVYFGTLTGSRGSVSVKCLVLETPMR